MVPTREWNLAAREQRVEESERRIVQEGYDQVIGQLPLHKDDSAGIGGGGGESIINDLGRQANSLSRGVAPRRPARCSGLEGEAPW